MKKRPHPPSNRKPRAPDRVVSIALTQMACTEDPRANRSRQARLVEKAAAAGAQIVCTQELFTSQYFCQTEDHRFFALAEPIPGPSTDALAKVAKKRRCVVIASLFEKRAAGLYHNSAAIIDADGSILGVYRKMHIPDDPFYYEKFYFTPGDAGNGVPLPTPRAAKRATNSNRSGLQDSRTPGGTSAVAELQHSHSRGGFRAWKTRHATIGALICWDQWFPEGARLTALQGAEILFYPTAIGWHPAEREEYGQAQHEAWELMMRSHAVANGCFVCAPNRIGHEIIRAKGGKPVNPDGIQFWGQSFVAAPDGRVIARASAAEEQVLVVDCDLSRVEFSRTHWPFLRDRRVDAYGGMVQRYGR